MPAEHLLSLMRGLPILGLRMQVPSSNDYPVREDLGLGRNQNAPRALTASRGARFVLTNGSFELLHRDHLE